MRAEDFDMDDAELLSLFASTRDEQAFATLVDRHGPMVLGICRRVLRNGADADDAFQATFLLLAMKAGKIRQPELLGHWLFGVATRALRLARMNAQTTKCAAQLRQIGQALHAYTADNHQSLPAWSGWHTWPAGLPSDSDGPAWTIELTPYIGTPDSPVYNCPSFPLADKYRNYFLETQWCGRSNRSCMKLSEITESGKFVLSGDTTNMDHYVPDPREDDADPDDFGRGMLLWPWTGGIYMHHGGDNILFDDGHVLLYSRYDRYEMTFNPHPMEDHDDVTPD
jgi:hypothetical protein